MFTSVDAAEKVSKMLDQNIDSDIEVEQKEADFDVDVENTNNTAALHAEI